MKKGLLFAAALGAVMISGCGPFSCAEQVAKKDGKGSEKAEAKDSAKEVKKADAKEAKAE